jgi:hypothetical protein
MTSEEQQLRDELSLLASGERGRRLLQLSLRGIARGEHGVTAGCWRERGDAGCLFQHAYWEGVREGVFPDEGRPGDWIGSFVGAHDYGVVIRTIAAFDQLARVAYSDVRPRALLPDRVQVNKRDWNQKVEELLLAVLGESGAESATHNELVTASV